MLRALLLCLALAAPAIAQPGPALAQAGVTPEDLAEIRAVIHRQIEAFRRDDAREAFAPVSPGVQETFGTPERFLDTVRVSYRAVYRPATVAFLGLTVVGHDVVQQVQLTDRSGAVWLAYYGMQRQPDGSWRTNGCHLVQPARTIPT
ncbi:MAG TPA: DUF4864 domain-containing protein [Burkholderiales bacterium]|nr:DUF4864 domain-containing protein [Burkholderiales bacterium]